MSTSPEKINEDSNEDSKDEFSKGLDDAQLSEDHTPAIPVEDVGKPGEPGVKAALPGGDLEEEAPQETTELEKFLDFIVNRKSVSLHKSLLKRISEMGRDLHDFSDRDGMVIESLAFPPSSTEESRVFDYFDAAKALDLLLSSNSINRPIDPKKVYRYAIAILTGKYHESNPDGLMFNPEQKLMNGQHRLVALVVASIVIPNVNLKLPVEFNKPKELMSLIDVDRTSSDKAVMSMKQDGIEFVNDKYNNIRVPTLMNIVNSMYLGKIVSVETKIAFFKEHRDLIVDFYNILKKVSGIRYNATWAAAFVKAALPKHIGRADIEPLARRFGSTIHIGEDDPIKILWSKLMKLKDGKIKLKPTERYGITVKALRKALLEEKVSNLHATFVDWSEEEGRDWRVRGKDSPVLKAMSRKNH
jgi:hypothetical protein